MTILHLNIQIGNFTSTPSSESWIWKILPALISAIVTYLMFLLGQSVTRRREEEKDLKRLAEESKKNEKRLNDIREYFYVTFLKLKQGVIVQQKEFERITKQLKDDRSEKTGTFRPSSFAYEASPEQVLAISKEDTFRFFIQKHKNDISRIKVYSSFYIHLELFQEIKKQLYQIHKIGVKKFLTNQKIIEASKNHLQDIYSKIGHDSFKANQGGFVSEPYYVEFGRIHDNYVKHMNGYLQPIMNNLIFPLKALSLQPNYFGHKEALTILNICKVAEIHYGTILEDKLVDLKNYEHWVTIFKQMHDTMNKMKEIEFQDFSFNEEILNPEN